MYGPVTDTTYIRQLAYGSLLCDPWAYGMCVLAWQAFVSIEAEACVLDHHSTTNLHAPDRSVILSLVHAAAHSQMEGWVCFGPAQQLSDISLLQCLLALPAAKKALLNKEAANMRR